MVPFLGGRGTFLHFLGGLGVAKLKRLCWAWKMGRWAILEKEAKQKLQVKICSKMDKKNVLQNESGRIPFMQQKKVNNSYIWSGVVICNMKYTWIITLNKQIIGVFKPASPCTGPKVASTSCWLFPDWTNPTNQHSLGGGFFFPLLHAAEIFRVKSGSQCFGSIGYWRSYQVWSFMASQLGGGVRQGGVGWLAIIGTVGSTLPERKTTLPKTNMAPENGWLEY